MSDSQSLVTDLYMAKFSNYSVGHCLLSEQIPQCNVINTTMHLSALNCCFVYKVIILQDFQILKWQSVVTSRRSIKLL